MAGTIRVDTDALTTLLRTLKSIKLDLESGQNDMSSLPAQLDAAITGTAPSIANFENTFNGWAQLLDTLTTDIESAYATLTTVLADAQTIIHAL